MQREIAETELKMSNVAGREAEREKAEATLAMEVEKAEAELEVCKRDVFNN